MRLENSATGRCRQTFEYPRSALLREAQSQIEHQTMQSTLAMLRKDIGIVEPGFAALVQMFQIRTTEGHQIHLRIIGQQPHVVVAVFKRPAELFADLAVEGQVADAGIELSSVFMRTVAVDPVAILFL